MQWDSSTLYQNVSCVIKLSVSSCVQEIIQTNLWGGAFQISVLQWRLDRRPERGVQVMTKNSSAGGNFNLFQLVIFGYFKLKTCSSVSIWFIVGLACVAGFSLLTLVATIILLSWRRTSRRKNPDDPAAFFLDQLPPGRRQEEEEPSRSTRSSEVEEVSRAQERRRGWTEQRDTLPRYPVSRHLYQVKYIPVGKT